MLNQPFVALVNTDDLPMIYHLFDEAILFQKQNHYIGWENYDKEYIRKDVDSGYVFKLLQEEEIVCIFSVCYNDVLIWRERERNDAIYLHRLILNRKFQGEKIFQNILNWVLLCAKKKGLSYVRMDTWAENEKLIGYYKSYGFRFVENYTTLDTKDLPVQHRKLHVALLELDIPY